MAWLPVDQSLRDHRKLIALANELGVGTATATGHLVLFWLWCLDNAPSGILKRINGQQISTASAWSGNPNDLVNALLSSGFLEKCGRGGIGLRVHDWPDYGGKLLQARAHHRDVMRRSRDKTIEESRSEESREEKKGNPPISPPKGGQPPISEIRRVSLKTQSSEASELWERVLSELLSQVTKPNYETWLKETAGFALEHDKLIVLAPNEFAVVWLSTKLRPAIAKAASRLRGKPTDIELVLEEAP